MSKKVKNIKNLLINLNQLLEIKGDNLVLTNTFVQKIKIKLKVCQRKPQKKKYYKQKNEEISS